MNKNGNHLDYNEKNKFILLKLFRRYVPGDPMNKFLLILLISFFPILEVPSQIKSIDSLDNFLKIAKDTGRVNIMIKLSLEYASSDLNKADSIATGALSLLDNLDYEEGLIRCLNSLSYIKSSKGNYEEGHHLSDRAIALSEKTGNKELLAQSYNTRFSLQFKNGNYEQALGAAEKSIDIASEINSVRALAQAYDNIGIIKGIHGLHTEAIEYFLKSLKLFEELGDDSKTAIALMHVGHTFELAGSYGKALEYLKRSLGINKRIGNKYNEAWALVNIGVTYSRLDKLDTALLFYQQSLKIAEEIKDHRLILTNLDNIGGKYSLMKDFEKANIYLQKAYELSKKSGTNSRTVYIMGNLAENYLYMGQFDSAKIFGEQQLDLAINSGLISEQKVAYYVLAQIYDSLNDYRNAHKALYNYIAVNDSIFTQEKSMQIEALRESFESEQKEQAIASLEKEKIAARFRRNTFAVVAVLLFFIGGLLYNNQRLKTNKGSKLLKNKQEVDQMKSKFFANITHELRTPLTLILGPIETIKSEAQNPKISKHLDILKINADRLLNLINQLLELSKLEAGSLKLMASPGNIIPVVKGIVMAFESIAQSKEIALTIKSSEEETVVFFDREKLEKIIVNLVSNAIKFTAEKGNIQVVLVKSDHNFNIHIKDSGKGIPSDELDHIFDRFYQTGNHGDSTGTGIGLALAKELVELHHGSIDVKSELGKWTEFTIQLPLGSTHLSEAELVNIPEDTYIGQPLTFSDPFPEFLEIDISDQGAISEKPLLLLIEDNAEVRNYIIEILQSQYKILKATDGEEGVKVAIEKIPDIIISDVMMPKMIGYAVCDILKKDERTSHIPILLLTARITLEDKIEGLENQADDYITKPFVPKELMIRLKNLLASRRKLKEKFGGKLTLKPNDIIANSVEERFISRLLKIMEENIADERFGVEQLAGEIGMSRSQIHRKMIALTNNTPTQFIRIFRLTRAMDLLKKEAATASEIAYTVGFNSPSYFTKCFREEFGYPPGEVNQHT